MERERRQAPRIVEQVALAVRHAEGMLRVETQNLSASGVYCLLDRFLAPMTKLQIELELSNGSAQQRVRCAGVVVRVEPAPAGTDRARYRTAIFFSDIDARGRAAIADFVRRRTPGQPSTH